MQVATHRIGAGLGILIASASLSLCLGTLATAADPVGRPAEQAVRLPDVDESPTSSDVPALRPSSPTPARRQTGLGLPRGLGSLRGKDPLQLLAEFVSHPDGRTGELRITAQLQPRWHIYSLTQAAGGPLRTEIQLDPIPGVEIAGPFQPDSPPTVRQLEFFHVPVEEHAGRVTWSAPIRFVGPVDPQQLSITGSLDGQICQDEGACIPLSSLNATFAASFAGPQQQDPSAAPTDVSLSPGGSGPISGGSGHDPGTNDPGTNDPGTNDFGTNDFGTTEGGDGILSPHIRWHGQVTATPVSPGSTMTIVLRADLEPQWHVYAEGEVLKPGQTTMASPTIFGWQLPAGWTVQAMRPRQTAIREETGLDEQPVLTYYEQSASWEFDIAVPTSAAAGLQALQGRIGYQTCTKQTCDSPKGVSFAVQIPVAATAGAAPTDLQFSQGTYKDAAHWARSKSGGIQPSSGIPRGTLSAIDPLVLLTKMAIGVLGGALLNLMPCVLPVVGLKILSFVEQAKASSRQIFWLNWVYALGMLCVFMVLAALAVLSNLGWGAQFSDMRFKLAMIVLVFAMALSFLGVWEVHPPSFLGRGKSVDLQSRGGLEGAFFKGVFTTLLATPCSAPLLGPVFGYTIHQPPIVTFLIFFSVGIGMSSPYLMMGAFPRLIRFLPRPGVWMDTFKQLMGFMLLATVVFLMSTVSTDYYLPVLTLLLGIGFGCWWIGRLPLTATVPQRLRGWGLATGVSLLVGYGAFTQLGPSDHSQTKLPWQAFSVESLAAAQAEGRTVLVDFTADWCVNCKYNLKFAINTEGVRRIVDQYEITPLLADFTDRQDPMIKSELNRLGSIGLPVLAIYPAGRPEDVIVLPDLLTEGAVLKALEKAGPSRSGSRNVQRTAMSQP